MGANRQPAPLSCARPHGNLSSMSGGGVPSVKLLWPLFDPWSVNSEVQALWLPGLRPVIQSRRPEMETAACRRDVRTRSDVGAGWMPEGIGVAACPETSLHWMSIAQTAEVPLE